MKLVPTRKKSASCSDSVPPPKKRGCMNILDNSVAESLDVAKFSNRKAATVLTVTLKHVGCDPVNYNVNKFSICRLRNKSRTSRAENKKEDGKILEDISRSEIVDGLAIIISGKNNDQLLAVPILQSGTGESISFTVNKTSELWGITEQVKSMCFDTTYVNSGGINFRPM